VRKPEILDIAATTLLLALVGGTLYYGLDTGVMPARGISPNADEQPLKYWVQVSVYFGLTFIVLLMLVGHVRAWAQRIFGAYGGNFNLATLRAIVRGMRK